MANTPVTVGELIKILTKYTPSLEVFVDGYEYGITPLRKEYIKQVRIEKGAHSKGEWYGGPHEIADDGGDEGLILPR